MAPLRTWKELFLGERALKQKKTCRTERRYSGGLPSLRQAHSVAE